MTITLGTDGLLHVTRVRVIDDGLQAICACGWRVIVHPKTPFQATKRCLGHLQKSKKIILRSHFTKRPKGRMVLPSQQRDVTNDRLHRYHPTP